MLTQRKAGGAENKIERKTCWEISSPPPPPPLPAIICELMNWFRGRRKKKSNSNTCVFYPSVITERKQIQIGVPPLFPSLPEPPADTATGSGGVRLGGRLFSSLSSHVAHSGLTPAWGKRWGSLHTHPMRVIVGGWEVLRGYGPTTPLLKNSIYSGRMSGFCYKLPQKCLFGNTLKGGHP